MQWLETQNQQQKLHDFKNKDIKKHNPERACRTYNPVQASIPPQHLKPMPQSKVNTYNSQFNPKRIDGQEMDANRWCHPLTVAEYQLELLTAFVNFTNNRS